MSELRRKSGARRRCAVFRYDVPEMRHKNGARVGGAEREMKQKHIAVVGVSHRPEKYGFKIFRDMLEAGYTVSGISVRGGEVLGRKISKTLKELAVVPDIVITVVPAEITERIVEECRELGIKEIWMQPGSESAAAMAKAEEYGMNLTANACFMIQKGLW